MCDKQVERAFFQVIHHTVEKRPRKQKIKIHCNNRDENALMWSKEREAISEKQFIEKVLLGVSS